MFSCELELFICQCIGVEVVASGGRCAEHQPDVASLRDVP